MRIVMLAQFYPPTIGGEERHVKTLSEALVRRGHEVGVATIRHADQPELAIENGVRVHRVSGSLQRSRRFASKDGRQHAPPFPDPELTYNMHRLLVREQPDIVHAHNWLLHSFLPLMALHRTRFVVTLHDYSLVCAKKNMIREGAPCTGPGLAKCLPCAGSHYGALKGAITSLTCSLSSAVERRLVDKFIPVSEAVARRSGLDGSRQSFEVIPNFIPDSLGVLEGGYDEYLNQLPSEPFLLFVGDLMHLKGLHTLLEAYASFERAPPLVLIGRRCADTPTALPPNVRLLESWPHGAVMHAWSRCLFGLLPSVGLEACATVVMEANAVGKPMIVSRSGGLPEIVEEETTGLVVPPGNAVSLREAMRRLIEDGGLRRRMSEAALRKAETMAASAIVPRIERIYREVASKTLRLSPEPLVASHP